MKPHSMLSDQSASFTVRVGAEPSFDAVSSAVQKGPPGSRRQPPEMRRRSDVSRCCQRSTVNFRS